MQTIPSSLDITEAITCIQSYPVLLTHLKISTLFVLAPLVAVLHLVFLRLILAWPNYWLVD